MTGTLIVSVERCRTFIHATQTIKLRQPMCTKQTMGVLLVCFLLSVIYYTAMF